MQTGRKRIWAPWLAAGLWPMAEQGLEFWPMTAQVRGQTLGSDWPASVLCGRGAPRPKGLEEGGPEAQGAGERTGRVWGRWGEEPQA